MKPRLVYLLFAALAATSTFSYANNAIDETWLAKAQAHIAASEYVPHQTDTGVIANNRKHGIRSSFEQGALKITDRSSAKTLAEIRLQAFGREGTLQKLQASAAKVNGDRIELNRGVLTEWFINSPAGIEQGFDIVHKPKGEGRLVVQIDVDHAQVFADVSGARLESLGQKFTYNKLKAWDKTGRVLNSQMQVVGDDIVLRVDDVNARYPITIDPLLSSVADSTFISSQGSAQFGHDAANVGDVNGDGFEDIVITAYGYDGNTANEGGWFLFLGGAPTVNIVTDSSALSGQANARLGSSVAGVGDVNGDGFSDFVVGAEFYDLTANGDEGRAYLYFGGATFNNVADALLEQPQTLAQVGSSVAGAGDVNGDGYSDILVGAKNYDDGAVDSGAAFLYFGGASFNTTVDAVLTSSNVGVRMGTSVAGVGDVNADGFDDIVVGAPEYELPSGVTEANEGAAFLYLGGSSFNIGTDAHYQVNQLEARLGEAVSAAGDVNGDGYADVIVGSRLFDPGVSDAGAALIYFGSATPVVNPTPSVSLSSTQANAQFGANVASAGDVNGDGYADVLVGATQFDNGENNEGAAFVYLGGSTISAIPFRQLEVNQISAQLGFSLASGDFNRDGYSDVLVGSPAIDTTVADGGQVQLYFGGALTTDNTRDGFAFAGQGSGQMGHSVATGDVNGDGFADLITGQFGYDDGNVNTGRVSIFFGGPGGFNATADETIPGQVADQRFGSSVAVGDLNKDGYADLLIGASEHSNGEALEGVAYVFYSNAGVFGTAPNFTFERNIAGAKLGSSVAIAGDIDGDGDLDIVLGAPLAENTAADEGAMYVHLNRNGFGNTPDASLFGGQGAAFFGGSVASAGDVNGDGLADFMAGAIGFDAAFTNAGLLRVYYGSANLDVAADFIKDGGNQAMRFGSSVASAGDINGDGFGDIIVGAAEFTNSEIGEGAAFIYTGSATGLVAAPLARLEPNQASAGFGSSVAGVGDVNGDGFGDMTVGAPIFDVTAGNNEGAAFLYLGATAFNIVADARFDNTLATSRAGFSVAGGDINADGYADIVVGAPSDDNMASIDEGSVSVYFGNTIGRDNALQTFDFVNLSLLPIDQWGVSSYGNLFTVGGEVLGTRGKESVKLEVQACPQGAAFGAITCVSAVTPNWVSLAALGAGTQVAAIPIVPNGMYHWRARAQYIHATGTSNGIIQPTSPRVGPWRRLRANAELFDIRVTEKLFKDGFE